MEILITTIMALALLYYFGNYTFSVEEFDVSSKRIPEGFHGYRILQISDLHNSRYGKGNKRLLQRIMALDPDVIFYTGDMISKESPSKDHFRMLIEGLSHKYPAFFVDGNHEDGLKGKEKEAFIALLKRNGITHLENQSIRLEEEGVPITVHGLRLPAQYLRNTYDAQGKLRLSGKDLNHYLGRKSDGFHILLAHNPLYFPSYADYGADLTFSGHVHGGLLRLPFLGGVFSPDRSFFPRYSRGLYERDDSTMVVSPGIGGIRLRVFNRPALYVVKLRRKE